MHVSHVGSRFVHKFCVIQLSYNQKYFVVHNDSDLYMYMGNMNIYIVFIIVHLCIFSQMLKSPLRYFSSSELWNFRNLVKKSKKL
jgi:hypothetical protein